MLSWFAPPDPEEQIKKWKTELVRQQRNIEREVRGIEVEEGKVTKAIKAAAKRGDNQVAKNLAKELLRSRKTKERLYKSKAQMNSVCMQLRSTMATMKVAKGMQRSAEVMTYMNNLVKLPQFGATMRVMAQEMQKAGLIEEMMNDTLDDMDPDGIEEAADEEVEKPKVFEEITASIPAAGRSTLPTVEVDAHAAAEAERKAAADRALHDRLAALKST